MAAASDPKIISGISETASGLLAPVIDWARARSLWPMYFGLSCCFLENATALTPRYDMARFGSEVLRLSPRQADLLIIAGTVFKKVAPVVLRLYEQMAEPKWVISMGSCANTGGMYDVYSVVQGVNQILPVDVYIPGCPPRPEAVLQGLTILQDKIRKNGSSPKHFLFDGRMDKNRPEILKVGVTKDRDPRGPGMSGIRVRGTAATPPFFEGHRSEGMWTPPAFRKDLSEAEKKIAAEAAARFGDKVSVSDDVSDMLTLTAAPDVAKKLLGWLKNEAPSRFARLDDHTAVDESARRRRDDYSDFTLAWHLTSIDDALRVRVKAPLAAQETPPTVSDLWPNANWLEREVFDFFGLRYEGHPNLRRLIMPETWEGHPLLKSHPDRATGMPPYTFEEARELQPSAGDTFVHPNDDGTHLVLNVGPHHTATHGLMRFIVRMDGEMIEELDMDVGFHHRGAEKIGERQTWHQFIPYTDRVDYVAGASNNLPYVLAVEQLAGITVPERAQYIRVMLSELFRISNHLAYIGIFAHDLGAMTPTFYAFREREMILDIVEMITGARLHPSFFRIGGVAKDLPDGWKEKVDAFVKIFPSCLKDYANLTINSPVIRARTKGVGVLSGDDALAWGVSGPNLRASGVDWDTRKKTPYSSYDQFDFETPVAPDGDCLARYKVRFEECRQSLSIIEQAARNMPGGRTMTDDYRFSVPNRADMKKDIESLIHHFINVTRGPKVPSGESFFACEIPRGEQSYYVVSDGLSSAYRLHMRGASYFSVQVLPLLSVGGPYSDFIANLGSVDYTLPDIDR